MEEPSTPSTPSNDMWWKLMGDENKATKDIKTSITPRSSTSLWSVPTPVRDETPRDEDDDDNTTTDDISSKPSQPRKGRKSNEKPRRRSTGRSQDDYSRSTAPSRKSSRSQKKSRSMTDESQTSQVTEERLPKRSPTPTKPRYQDRISITKISQSHTGPITPKRQPPHVDRSPESRQERYSNDVKDPSYGYDDSASFSEAPTSTADKFLDILEDKICTFELNSPSLGEIEKRIEESWKEIESKTSQFFSKCRMTNQSNETSQGNANRSPIEDDASKDLTTSKSKKPVSPDESDNKNRNNGRDDEEDDDGDGARMVRCESDASEDSGEECEEQEKEDEPRKEQADKLRPSEKPKKDQNEIEVWKASDEDMESICRETIDLNSYTDTYLDRAKERHKKRLQTRREHIPDEHSDAVCTGNSESLGSTLESDTLPMTLSTDYDASTLTTFMTQSLATLDPPSMVQASHTQQTSAPAKTPMNMSLTIFEPTNASSLLVQNSKSVKKSQKQEMPLILPAHGGQGHPNPFAHLPDEDPAFQRRCFSPGLKKNAGGLGLVGSASTSSTCHSESKSDISGGYGNQYQSNSHHAYIAFFERGTKAHGAMRLYEHPTPPAFPTLNNEIVVRVAYSTVSHTDCAVRRGTYWGDDSERPLNLPIIPGVAFSGYVTQLNRAAMRSGLRYNDRVLSLVRVGANARHLCISRDQVVTVPDEIKDDQKIACLPEIYLGAFQALHLGQKNGSRYKKSSLSGKTVLILGGATILGKALIELCHAGGAYAIYATGKKRHFPIIEAARALPLNRDTRHWYSLLMGRVDLVIGLDNDSYSQSEASSRHLEVLSTKGRAVLLGSPETTCEATVGGYKKITVYNVFDSWDKDLKQAKRDLSHLCKLLMEGSINPHVLETIPLSQVAHAQDTVENRDFSSFLLCDPWIPTKRHAEKMVQNSVIYSETAMTCDATEGTKSKSKLTKNSTASAAESAWQRELVSL